MSYEMIAEKLWEMLEAIENIDNEKNTGDSGHRRHLRKKRSEILQLRHVLLGRSGGELVLIQHKYDCENCGDAWVGTVFDYECPRCDAPMGADLHVPYATKSTRRRTKPKHERARR